MKRKFLALKLYLMGLTAGLFIFGWSAIAHTDAVQTSAAAVAAAPSQQTTMQTSNNTIQPQPQAQAQQPVTSQPRVRTRTS